jgi:hypothetical protein
MVGNTSTDVCFRTENQFSARVVVFPTFFCILPGFYGAWRGEAISHKYWNALSLMAILCFFMVMAQIAV